MKKGEWTRTASGGIEAAGVALREGEYALRLVASAGSAAAALPGDAGVVVLDTTLTPELEAEGLARDLIRAIQQARREADLHVSDRISLRVCLPAALLPSLNTHASLIAGEVLATSTAFEELGDETATAALSDGTPVVISLSRA